MSKTIDINAMPHAHANLRAEDWRSPLVRRLLGCDAYHDGSAVMSASYASNVDDVPSTEVVNITWSGLGIDFGKTIKTYQAPTITEMATLGLACGMVSAFVQMEITEVTRRGERADYWLGDREMLLEVSGQESGNLPALCEQKSQQLQENPFGKDGFVCVANYGEASARLWFYPAPEEQGPADE